MSDVSQPLTVSRLSCLWVFRSAEMCAKTRHTATARTFPLPCGKSRPAQLSVQTGGSVNGKLREGEIVELWVTCLFYFSRHFPVSQWENVLFFNTGGPVKSWQPDELSVMFGRCEIAHRPVSLTGDALSLPLTHTCSAAEENKEDVCVVQGDPFLLSTKRPTVYKSQTLRFVCVWIHTTTVTLSSFKKKKNVSMLSEDLWYHYHQYADLVELAANPGYRWHAVIM